VTAGNSRRAALRREVSRRFRSFYAGMVVQLTPGSLSIWKRVQDQLAGQRAENPEAQVPAVPPAAVMHTTMQQQPVQLQQQKTQDDQKREPKPES
jgi:hypothetical protein